MPKIIIIFLTVVIVAAAFLLIRSEFKNASDEERIEKGKISAKDFPTWREFISTQDHFKVMLPSVPQHVTKHVKEPGIEEELKYDTYISVNDSSGVFSGGTFMISAITYPHVIAPEGVTDLLKNVITTMLKRNQENQLKSMEEGKFGQQKAMDFTIENKDASIFGKVFSRNNVVYVLVMINNVYIENSELPYNFFINSFTFFDGKN